MKKKHIIFLSIIGVIILSGIIAYVVKNNKDSAGKKGKEVALYTIPAKEKIFVNGVVVPEKTENIYRDETKGTINKVSVTNGQVVNKGDALFTYRNSLVTDEIDKGNQEITNANKQKKKLVDKQEEAKQLLEKQKEEAKQQAEQAGVDPAAMGASAAAGTEAQISGYSDQIDAVQAQIDTSKGMLKNSKEKEYTYIKAPINGKVILNDSKDMTKPYIVIESTTVYVKGNINEKDQTKVKENQKVDILIFAINKTITGKVKSVGNSPAAPDAAAGAQGATGGASAISYYDANVSLDSQTDVINGFHVQATVKLKEEDMKIPKSAILEEAGKQYVFKVVDKKLKKQAITYKKGVESEVVVLSGLNENDRIAKTTKEMKEGISVE
ncbi:efflux RND transporter periplasmic adaptor subunit [Clostridium sp. CF011]|uniref:efflux RND transporter periplasmic adaptor subunit n=1 Tax=unclassified Clostridium TaxID=2614128 RepID=UPI001C0B367B|nr:MULTISPECIES: efflux RND transporter periplasmic adaptor subunit [unclassified Clostridium]MBU3092015.1 efflux RND transporter periplasmic adaptor subunit [Clostridium sp. CF011]MBW9146601.1 efflux RND transporter periplasmic adaptor subunit [Clostridium sp. CM027]UVE42281.1 efflux RND transporter periplasmic adaptor subunit [Clostridium sp. CM027]WAG71300.1 efflux RND transporter periplasmic adaptor subunit [Clostridium sp. CF011]